MPLPWQPLGGNLLPPRHVDLYLRMSTDGNDRCVSRQARWAARKVCSPGFLVCASNGRLAGGRLCIDNGGCSLERRPLGRSQGPWWGLQRVSPSGKALCQITSRGQGVVQRCSPFADPGENNPYVAWAPVDQVPWQALWQCARGRFCNPLDPCFHFFPAAKCPTHLK